MKKKLLLILLFLLFLLTGVIAVRQQQKLRKKAEVEKEAVSFFLISDMPVVRRSWSFHLTAKLRNEHGSPQLISGAQFKLWVAENASFSPQDSFCLPPFDHSLKLIKVEGQEITVMCTIHINDSPVILNQQSEIDFAEIKVNVAENPSFYGVIPFIFKETKVIEAGLPGTGAINITKGGEDFYVSLAEEVTPTITGAPSISPSGIFTPSPSVSATNVPTLTSPACPRKSQGDANCDGRIDGVDYGIFVLYQCMKTNSSQICSDLRADFNGNGEVDEEDRLIVINNLEL